MPNQAMAALQQRIAEDYRKGTLPLPALPEVVLRIRELAESEECDSDSLSRVVQLEPSVAGRLLLIANSPAYRGQKPIDGCREAVTRLGLKAVRNLATSVALEGVYRSDTPRLTGLMQESWHQATRVAALCHVLARLNRAPNPERALLLGLLHNVGRLVLYRYLDREPRLLDELPEGMLERGVHGRLGRLLLRSWGFDEGLASAVAGAENWGYEHEGEGFDDLDLLLSARAHDQLGESGVPLLPELPAFARLPISTLGPDASLELIQQADGEVNEMMRALRGE